MRVCEIKKYNVQSWHGYHKGLEALLVESLGGKYDSGTSEFTGALEEFAVLWNDKFMFYPDINTIFVTQHYSFGQR